jgi:beta-lactamase superfamily II metal-dependent hydrolase
VDHLQRAKKHLPWSRFCTRQQGFITLANRDPDLDKTPPSYAEEAALSSFIADAVRTVVDAVKEKLHVETLDANPPATSASNETSVVQLGIFGTKRILLTGDVGPDGLNEAADFAELLGLLSPPDLGQVPHHGSRRNVKPAALNRWLGAYPSNYKGDAFISVGAKQDRYPRKTVNNAFLRRGYPVYSTRTAWKSQCDGYTRRAALFDAVAEPFSEDVDD